MSRSLEGRIALAAIGLLLFAFAVIRTAWLCDDAFITFRTLDNFVHGYGLRWNPAERVQSFTHPLWLLTLAPIYAITREPYFTPLVVSALLSLAAVWLFMTQIASSVETMAVVAATFVSSKAFVEFSTSGLENPLTAFLLAVFFIVYARPSARRGLWLWTIAGLLMLNRLDMAVLLMPIIGADAWRRPWRDTLRDAAVGLLPLIAWESFAIVYYGFPVPNTAYAKLQTGVPAMALLGQGLLYFVDSIVQDPVTLLVIGLALVACLYVFPRTTWPMAFGVAAYMAATALAGGDFMSGRFLVAPLVCALAAAAHLRSVLSPSIAMTTVAAIVLVGATGTHPPLVSGADAFAGGPVFGVSGVADERSFDYPNLGLLRWTRERPLPAGEWVDEGRNLNRAPKVVVRANIGQFGFYAGPEAHIVDAYALSDPLLARLPATTPWRIGHFERAIPAGYLESIRHGDNRIADPAVASLYRDVTLVTQDRLWTRRRWHAIRRLNLGW